MIFRILEKLPPSEDFKSAQVCKQWNKIVKILPDLSLKVIQNEIWIKHLGIEIKSNIPPLPKHISQIVRSDRKRLAGKKETPTCTAILMLKGLTAKRLIEYAKNPKVGYSTEFDYIYDKALSELGDRTVEESYWFVMTDDFIEETRGLHFDKQKNFLKVKTNNQLELPTFLEVLAACVMHHVIYSEHLLGRDVCTYTCCQDLVDGSPLIVGGFGGLFVHNYNAFQSTHKCFGAVACRKFF